MTSIYKNNNFEKIYDFVWFTNNNLESNPVAANMYKSLNEISTVLISLNHFDENDRFFIENIHYETIKQTEHIDGYVTDQVIVEDNLDESFLRELSTLIHRKHFLIGPSFSKIPYFLQSKNLEIAIQYNVTAVMFDVRNVDFKNYNELKALAQLKAFARKRIDIIPVVESKEKRDELLSLIPFDTICILN